MKAIFKINYHTFQVDSEDIPTLMRIFMAATDEQGNSLELSASNAPDPIKKAAREEAMNELGKEVDQYRKWWLSGSEENKKLNERIAALESANAQR